MVVRISEGGTGQTTAPGARIALGLSDQNIIDIVTPSFGGPYQPLDADLTAISSLATASYGRDFLIQVSAAASRTYLGLGTMATETAANYLTTASAASTYLTIANAASTYLTISTAASTYLPLAGGTMVGVINTNSAINFSLAAGNARFNTFQTSGSNRWSYGSTASPESGANAGSNFQINRYDDSGTLIGDVLTIFRSDGYFDYTGFINSTAGFGVDTPVSTYKGLSLNASNNSRWFLGSNNDTESGSNAGANFVFERYSDAGSFLGTPIKINRDSGLITLESGQLKFPATQNASSDANTLDDYEEGTWTGTITCTGLTLTRTWIYGNYQKIGRKVTCWGSYTITARSGAPSGNVVCAGLPFTGAAVNQAGGINREQTSTGDVGWCYVPANTTSIHMDDFTNNLGTCATLNSTYVFEVSYLTA